MRLSGLCSINHICGYCCGKCTLWVDIAVEIAVYSSLLWILLWIMHDAADNVDIAGVLSCQTHHHEYFGVFQTQSDVKWIL